MIEPELYFEKDLVLENDFVLLRPLLREDFEHLLNFSLNEPNIWKYSLISADGEANLKNYIDIALKAKQSKTEYPFIVYDKIKKAYAGSTRFYDINFNYKTIQLGYTWYGKNFQGTYVNKNCKYLLFEFVFEKLLFERLELRADFLNERSIAAMKSIGCKVDGVLRSNMPTRNVLVRRDSIVLSVLKDEWFSSMKNNLQTQLKRFN
jgi:N-acetyltransferase